MREHFPPASVKSVNRDPSPGANNTRDDNNRQSRPNNRSNGRNGNKNGRDRSKSPANGNNRSSRDTSADSRSSEHSRPFDNPRPQSPAMYGHQSIGPNNHQFRSPSPGPYRGQPQSYMPQPYRPQSPGPRYQSRPQTTPRWYDRRSQTPPHQWTDRRRGTLPAGYNAPRQYYNSGYQANSRYRPPTLNLPAFRRRLPSGCFVCGAYGCHSRFHDPRTVTHHLQLLLLHNVVILRQPLLQLIQLLVVLLLTP